ncbi:AI-2E family transporter [Acidithiobacillus sp. MC6.1]|nr:AI-2E family transporter [Acidithiobacillus sp. MC6.1]
MMPNGREQPPCRVQPSRRVQPRSMIPLLILSLAAAYVLSPFAVPIAAGTIFAVVGWPWQKALERRGLHAHLASILHALFWLAMVVLPVWLVIQTAIPSVLRLVHHGIDRATILGDLSRVPWAGPHIVSRLQHLPVRTIPALTHWMETHISALESPLHHVTAFALHTLIAVLVVYALGLHGDRLSQSIHRGLVALTDTAWAFALESALLRSARAVVGGLLGVAVFEGVLIGAVYAFAGVPLWPVWAVATAVLSPVPFGASAVMILAALVLFFTGHWLLAILLLTIGHLVMFSADLVLRPWLTGSRSHTPILVTLLSILGGVASMGLIGLLAGPILVLSAREVWTWWEGPENPSNP